MLPIPDGLTPPLATTLFIIGVMSGYQYRRNWVAEGPRWKAWTYGVAAALSFGCVALIPLTSA
ncbi:MAG: hypothetical protein AAGH41_08865 [Pseudomonadota bacterium]